MTKSLVPLLLLTLFSCSSSKKLGNAREEVWTISDRLHDCVGEGPMKCLAYRTEDSDNWAFLYTEIEGFAYQEGRHYKLKVRIDSVEEAPADASALKYTLMEILEERESKSFKGLLNGSWGMVEAYGEQLLTKESLALQFDMQKGMVGGNSGCNSFGGQFQIMDGESHSIRISGLFSTEMYCEGLMEREQKIQRALREAQKVEVAEAELRLLSAGEVILRARRID